MRYTQASALLLFSLLDSPANAELSDEDWSQPAMSAYEKCVVDKAIALLPAKEQLGSLVSAAIYFCREERLKVSIAVFESATRQFPKLTVEQRLPIIEQTNKLVDRDIALRATLKVLEKKSADSDKH